MTSAYLTRHGIAAPTTWTRETLDLIEHRSDLIWSALTIVQNWIAKGKPAPLANGDELGSFESWAYVHGGIIEAAGLYGFLHDRDNLDSLSGDEQAFSAFVDSWSRRYQTNVVWATEIIELAKTTPQFPIKGHDDSGIAKSFGRCMQKFNNRVINGYKILRQPKGEGGARWKLEPVTITPQEPLPF